MSTAAQKSVKTSSKQVKPRVGRPTRDESKRLSEKLLITAASIFASRGYAQTSVDRISAESGISKRTIYAWFGGKTELFQAVISHLLAGLDFPEDGAINESRGDGVEELQALVENIIRATMQPSFLGIYRIFLREVDQFSEVLMAFQETTRIHSQKLLMSVLERYPEFKRLRLPNEDVANAILGLTHSLVVLTSLNVQDPRNVSPTIEARKIVGIVLNGCMAPACDS